MIVVQPLSQTDEPAGQARTLEFDGREFSGPVPGGVAVLGVLASEPRHLRPLGNYAEGRDLTYPSGQRIGTICQVPGGPAVAILPNSIEYDWPRYQRSVAVESDGSYEVLSDEGGYGRLRERGRVQGGDQIEQAAAVCLTTFGDHAWLQALWESQQSEG